MQQNKWFNRHVGKVTWFNMVLLLLSGVVLMFIIAPLMGMFLKVSGVELIKTSMEQDIQKSILLTLWTSMAGTVVLSLFAVPFAYLLARMKQPIKGVIEAIVDIPVIIPHSAAGIALLSIISREGFIGKPLANAGVNLVGTSVGITIAMSFVSIPFLINAAKVGFMNVPEHLEKAALTFGASQKRVFFTISLPLASRSIITGLIMMWARGLSEFGAVVIIAYYPMITPVLIYERFSSYGLKYSRPVAVLFVLICLMIFIILRLLSRKRHDHSK